MHTALLFADGRLVLQCAAHRLINLSQPFGFIIWASWPLLGLIGN